VQEGGVSKRKWIFGGLVSVVLVLAAAFAALYFSRGTIRKRIRQRTEAYLSARFRSDVTFQSFSVSLRHGIGVAVTGLTLRYHGRNDLPPLIEIRRAEFETAFSGFLRKRIHIRRVELDGLQIHTPPRKPGAKPWLRATDENLAKKYPVVIDEIVANDAILEPLPKDPSKTPHPFIIYHVELHDFQFDSPARFQALLTNPVPRGEIACQGTFGPWEADEPSATPVDARFTFDDADLGTLKGLSGTLSSRGNFHGPLDELQVEGETDTPNFALRTSSGPMALHTEYSAVVDGTNGDVILNKVVATFLSTALVVHGEVVDLTPLRSRTIELDAVSEKGRIQDLLRLAVQTDKPAMTGDARLKVHIDIPEKNEDLLERMRLKGQFTVDDALFTNDEIQGRVNTLSHKAQGEPKLGAEGQETSTLHGAFRMAGGVVKFSRLRFGVEGAALATAGTYDIDNGHLDFRGKLALEASLSQTTTGVKSFFLKAVDPFFRGKNGGTVLPIKITGTKDAPKYGIDLFDHGGKKSAPSVAAPKVAGGQTQTASSSEAAQ
jgi:AsmA-like C-terminal region